MHALLIIFALLLPPGLYERAGHAIYVGTEHSLPDKAVNQFFDPSTQATGELKDIASLRQQRGIHEETRQIGSLGVSVYYGDTKKRATVILVHGNDAETREMGFIIPYFVLNGINVVSYDQRGTGSSTGSWMMNGPSERATDVEGIFDALQDDAHIDAKRIGIWGFSNGGWTAPIVAVNRPLAFMILKSAPAESLASNIDYEVTQAMKGGGFGASETQEAIAMWHALEDGLHGIKPWNDVAPIFAHAKAQKWFGSSLMLDIPIPPPPDMQTGLRYFVTYDPEATLKQVQTPTLALYGSADTKVDVPDSSSLMPQYIHAKDLTVHLFPDAKHTLILNGADRYAPGYPQIMLDWLAQRGFTK